MIRSAFLIAGLALASAASAQSTTTCRTVYGTTTCDTIPQNGSGGINWGLAGPGFDASQVMRSFENGSVERQNRDQALADRQQQLDTAVSDQQATYRRRQAGSLIAAGQCADARKYALTEGDFDLVGQVDRACISPQP